MYIFCIFNIKSWILEFFDFYYFFSKEDFLVAITLYAFIKYIIVCSYVELIWPTQFFNRRNIITSGVVRNRTYTETTLKLVNSNYLLVVFYTQLFLNKVVNS